MTRRTDKYSYKNYHYLLVAVSKLHNERDKMILFKSFKFNTNAIAIDSVKVLKIVIQQDSYDRRRSENP